MNDLLQIVQTYTGKSGAHSTPCDKAFVYRQFLGSLVLRRRLNLLCIDVVSQYLCDKDILVVLSRDAVQYMACDVRGLRLQRTLPNPLPGDLSAMSVTSQGTTMLCSSSAFGKLPHGATAAQSLLSNPHTRHILCIDCAPDGSIFATGHSNRTVTMWSSRMELMHCLYGHTDWVRFVKFARRTTNTNTSSSSQSTLQLFSVADNGVIFHWDPVQGVPLGFVEYTSGQSVQGFDVHFASALLVIAFNSPILSFYRARPPVRSDDGDTQSPALLRLQQLGLVTTPHRGMLTTVKFSPDAQWVVSAAEDETLAVTSVNEPRRTYICNAFISRRSCLTFMCTFTSVCLVAAPPQSSVIIVAACAIDGSVIKWVVNPRTGCCTYNKMLQLHLGALISIDTMHLIAC